MIAEFDSGVTDSDEFSSSKTFLYSRHSEHCASSHEIAVVI
jgi:hypothetical protein